MDEPQEPRLLDRVHDTIRRKHYSIRTEQAYVDWIKRFILFHDKRHPAKLGATEVEAFLTHLAVDREVAAATQNQAQSALLFLYREILGIELPWLDDVERAKRPIKLPVVLTVDEVVRVLDHLKGTHRLIGRLMYGSGLRILEALRLRVKDVDFARREILVRDGKGAKDRVTLLPRGTAQPLCAHLQEVRVHCTCRISTKASARCGCRSRWRASIRRRRGSGRGSTCSRPIGGRRIRAAGRCDATISAISRFNARCARRCGTRASTSSPRRTRCATRSRRTCLNRATTFAPCRNCSVTPTSARR